MLADLRFSESLPAIHVYQVVQEAQAHARSSGLQQRTKLGFTNEDFTASVRNNSGYARTIPVLKKVCPLSTRLQIVGFIVQGWRVVELCQEMPCLLEGWGGLWLNNLICRMLNASIISYAAFMMWHTPHHTPHHTYHTYTQHPALTTNTQHTELNTPHTAHNTQHTTHNTQYITLGCVL